MPPTACLRPVPSHFTSRPEIALRPPQAHSRLRVGTGVLRGQEDAPAGLVARGEERPHEPTRTFSLVPDRVEKPSPSLSRLRRGRAPPGSPSRAAVWRAAGGNGRKTRGRPGNRAGCSIAPPAPDRPAPPR